jgi:hypothetical protein
MRAAFWGDEALRWADEAQRLNEEYDQTKAAYLALSIHDTRGRDGATRQKLWDESQTAKNLLSQGEWAHRKAVTAGITYLVLTMGRAPL